MTIPSALTLRFKIFQKVELIDVLTERLKFASFLKSIISIFIPLKG